MDGELRGGNSTVVVRVGDTVRRGTGPWTPAVHALLRSLREAGITEVPEPLGFDEEGREILSFLPGEAGTYPLPNWLWAPQILEDAATLLRRAHDASVRLVDEPLSWASPRHEPVEVICHNDAAPYNMVFQEGRLAGFIDFDAASPGPRVWDLTYLAYRLAPFVGDAGPEAPTGASRLDRVDRLLSAYGPVGDVPISRDEVLQTMLGRLEELASFTEERAAGTDSPLRAHAAMYRNDRHAIALLVDQPG